MAEGHRLVYGLHAVRALLEARPEAVMAAYLLDKRSGRLRDVADTIDVLGVRVEKLRRAELDRLARGGAHQGVIVEALTATEFTLTAFEELVVERGSAARLLVLDGVDDPHNLGACLRTADAAGMDAVVVPRSRSTRLTGAAMKAATGAAERVPLLSASNLARTLRWLQSSGIRIVGADADAGQALFEARFEPPIALVVGGEGRGLRRLTRELCDEIVAIPMAGPIGSLNMSVAAGIVMFEMVRRNRAASPTT